MDGWIVLFLFINMMSIDLSKAVYSRDDLLGSRSTGRDMIYPIPAELKKSFRGCRAGAKLKAKLKARKWKPFLPSVVKGNVNLFSNFEELLALVRNQLIYSIGSVVSCAYGDMAERERTGLLCEHPWLLHHMR